MVILYVNDSDMYESIFEDVISAGDFIISVNSSNPDDLNKNLHNKKEYNLYLKNLKKDLLDEKNRLGYYLFVKDKYSYFKNKNIDKVIKDIEFVEFFLDNNNIKDYLIKNPFLLSKKIVVDYYGDILNKEKIYEIIEEYNGILNPEQIYIKMDGNMDYVNVIDALKTIDKITDISNSIKKLNMSPIEEVMYTYDLVRHRVYNIEDKNERSSTSRDLSKILEGDKIVCVGYSELFKAILTNLNINIDTVRLRGEKNGHERCVAYIKDDKYDINGVYYFDPTWDSRRKNDFNDYLYYYKYFCLTLEDIKRLDNGRYNDKSYQNIDKNILEKIYNFCDKSASFSLSYIRNSYKYISSINNMTSIINKKLLLKQDNIFNPKQLKKEIKENEKEYKKIIDCYDKPINGETMLNILNNVRKIEYYQNPDLYPYDLNSLFITFDINWDFTNENYRLLKSIFSNSDCFTIEEERKMKLNEYRRFVNASGNINFAKEVLGVRLTRTLKNELERKKTNN